MEAVPRLPMLSFELKHSPEATAFDQLKKVNQNHLNMKIKLKCRIVTSESY